MKRNKELLKKIESTLKDKEHIKKLKNEDITLLKRGVRELKIKKLKNENIISILIYLLFYYSQLSPDVFTTPTG